MANTHCLDLEASSSQYAYISDASQTGLDLTSSMTIEAWVKFESTPTSGNGMIIVSKDDYSSSTNRAYVFKLENNGGTLQLQFNKYYSGSSESEAVNWTPTTGVYYHLSVTRDGSTGDVKFYVNSIQQGSTQAGATTALQNTSSNFAIGCNFNSTTPVNFIDGLIDDVRIWNDVRTQSEIQSNMFKELVGNEANLVGYWKLNNNYLDETSNNNDLTASGSPVFLNDIAFSDSDNQIEHCVDGDTVALWHLNGTAGTAGKVNDESSNNLDLTENGSPTSTTGWDGATDGAYSLSSASTQYLTTGSVQLFTNTFTISLWLKPSVSDFSNKEIFSYVPSSGGSNTVKSEGYNTSGIRMLLYGSSGNLFKDYRVNSGIFSNGTWVHLDFVWDGTNYLLYVNGVLIGIDNKATDNSGSLTNTSRYFALGIENGYNGTGNKCDGAIDEVLILNRAKSSNEIMKYYGGISSGKFYAGSGDGGSVFSEANPGRSWSSLKAQSGTASTPASANGLDVYTIASTTTNQFRYLGQLHLPFDLSALPETFTTQLGTLNLYGSTANGGKVDNFNMSVGLVESTMTTTTVANGDYERFNTTRLATDIDITNWSNSAYNTFNLNTAGLNFITDGTIKLCIALDKDIDNSAPTWSSGTVGGLDIAYSETASNTSDPYLWVEYYSGGGTTYTLTCDTGAFTLTGNDTTFRRTYILVCATGSFTLTGISALFKRGYGLICETGNFILTGINALLRFSGWSRRNKPSTSWDNRTKPTTNWTK